MNAATKLVSFAAVVAAVFGSALAVGAIAGPLDVGTQDHNETVSGGHGDDAHISEVTPRQGLSIAAAGFRFEPLTPDVPADEVAKFRFRIVDDAGNAVRDFELNHERELHLIVVSRNLIDYTHVHPVRDELGAWSVDLPALASGSYRVLADFRAAGADAVTLGADLVVDGALRSVPLPKPASTTTVGEYDVEIKGVPRIGASELSFAIRRNGEPVVTEPYLGAAAHLVGIRAGDMAYLHVHSTGEGHDDDAIRLTAEIPSAGSYRLFLDFSHEGVVRTAALTVVVGD